MTHCVEIHNGIPPGLSAGQAVGMTRLLCRQPRKPHWSHGNTLQFASPLQGQKEFLAHIGYFNFSHVLQINRNPEENEQRSHIGWIVCSLEKELKSFLCHLRKHFGGSKLSWEHHLHIPVQYSERAASCGRLAFAAHSKMCARQAGQIQS